MGMRKRKSVLYNSINYKLSMVAWQRYSRKWDIGRWRLDKNGFVQI